MIIKVECHDCHRKFEWTVPDCTLAEIRKLGFENKAAYIADAKRGFACEDCIGWGSSNGDRARERLIKVKGRKNDRWFVVRVSKREFVLLSRGTAQEAVESVAEMLECEPGSRFQCLPFNNNPAEAFFSDDFSRPRFYANCVLRDDKVANVPPVKR